MWKRILVPHDFAECAARALEVAVEFAARDAARLRLLHISPLPPNLAREALLTPPGVSTPTRVDELTTSGARRDLESTAAPLVARGFSVRTLAIAIEAGDPGARILRVADRDRGHRCRHARPERSLPPLAGGIAEKVIRGARIPVVTVRTAAPEAKPTREESLAEDELGGEGVERSGFCRVAQLFAWLLDEQVPELPSGEGT